MRSVKPFIFIAFFVFLAGLAKSQNCTLYFPSKEGAETEMTQYDAKNKVTGTVHQKITGKESTAAGVKVNFESESFDKKGKSISKGQFSVKCENGVFYIDMKSMMNGTMAAYKDMDVQVKTDDLDMPAKLTAGQTLKDGMLTMDIKSGGMQIMSMKMTITNRKVEAVETITTPAGTFECYKISSQVDTKMMISVQTKNIEWYAKEVGMVKSETYDKNGKLMGTNVLTKLKN